MIELPRALAVWFRSVVRKSVMAADPRGPCPLVLLQGGPAGLTLSCSQGDVAVGYHGPGSRPPARLALPLSALASFEGRGDGLVVLEAVGPFKLRASWSDRGVARAAEFDTASAEGARPAPQPADNAIAMPGGFLTALAEAGRTTNKEVGRYNLSRVLLRGQDGRVVATDGKQLLIQNGFPLPWADSLLIPRLPVFEGRELPADQPVRVGLSDGHVTLEVGPWLFCVKAEKAQRYPDVNAAVPRAQEATARLRIHPEDAPALLQALPRLPGAGEQHSPVTLDVSNGVVVRARGPDVPAATVVLERSTLQGAPVRVAFGRLYLIRALRLGFSEVVLHGPGWPLLTRDRRRTYCWMPLEDSAVVSATDEKATEAPALPAPESPDDNQPGRRNPVMPPNNNGTHPQERNGTASVPEAFDPLAEAETLRTRLQEALGSATRLVAALRQDRRRSRAVRSALASLRRLDDRGR